MKAKDIMIPFKDYLKPDNTLSEAVNLLKTATRGEQRVGVMGLPVLDDKDKLVGILSMTDILRAVHPSYMDMMNLGDFTWDGMLESLAKQVRDKKVKELMTRKVITVHEDDPHLYDLCLAVVLCTDDIRYGSGLYHRLLKNAHRHRHGPKQLVAIQYRQKPAGTSETDSLWLSPPLQS